MGNISGSPGHYEVLQVHPAAPLDLIAAAYWRLAREAQAARREDNAAEFALYQLTRSYQILATVASRAEYDRSLQLPPQPLVPRLPRRRPPSLLQRLLNLPRRNHRGDAAVDYYEVLRVNPSAEPAVLAEAYIVMRNYYLRLVRVGDERPDLLIWLEEAYAVTSDPVRRAEYDRRRENGRSLAKQVARPSEKRKAASPKGKTAAQQPRARMSGRAVRPQAPAKPLRQAAPDLQAAGRGLGRLGPVTRASTAAAWRLAGAAAGGAGRASRRGYGLVSSLVKRTAPRLGHAVTTGVTGQDREADAAEEQALLRRLTTAPKLGSGAEVPAEAPTVAEFTLIDGPGRGASFSVRRLPVTLGGSEECDITLPGLPSEQARLLYREGRFFLYGISHNPAIEVNGESVAWSVLENGDALGLGPYKLCFRLPSS